MSAARAAFLHGTATKQSTMTDPQTARGSAQSPRSKQQPFIRPLAFGEALKFTPLTTSPLQPSDQIPLPVIDAGAHRVQLANEIDRKTVAGLKLTQDVQSELHHLLQPKSLSEL